MLTLIAGKQMKPQIICKENYQPVDNQEFSVSIIEHGQGEINRKTD